MTDTPQPTETPLPTDTDTPDPTLTPSNTDTPTPTEVATETASSTGVPFLLDPPLTLVYNETFDDGLLEFITIGSGWTLFPQDSGQALQVNDSDSSAAILYTGLQQLVVQARLYPQIGVARLSARESAAGAYSVTLDNMGQLQLYRADQLVDSLALEVGVTPQWRSVRLSVVDGAVQVAVDGVNRLVYIDPMPLPAGVVAIYSTGVLQVDDLQLWIPSSDPAADPQIWTTQSPEQSFGGAALQTVGPVLYVGEPQGGINIHSTTSMSGWWPQSHSLTVEYNDPVVGMLFNVGYQLDNPNSPFPWREIRGGALDGTGMFGRSHLEEAGGGQVCFMASGDLGAGSQNGEINCAIFFPESSLFSRQGGFPPAGGQGQVYQQLFEVWTAGFSGATYWMGPTRFVYYGTPPPTPTPTFSLTPTPTPLPPLCSAIVRISPPDTAGRVRESPNGAIIEPTLANGDQVNVVGRQDNWFYIVDSTGRFGWMHESILNRTLCNVQLPELTDGGTLKVATYDYELPPPPSNWNPALPPSERLTCRLPLGSKETLKMEPEPHGLLNQAARHAAQPQR